MVTPFKYVKSKKSFYSQQKCFVHNLASEIPSTTITRKKHFPFLPIVINYHLFRRQKKTENVSIKNY